MSENKIDTVIVREITRRAAEEAALREREDWFKEIFEGSRDAIFLVAPDARVIEVNQAACELTGYGKDELLQMSISNLHVEEDLQVFHAGFPKIASGAELTSEALIRRKDGTKVPVEFSNRKIPFRGNQVFHTVARDITERKRSQQLYRMLLDAIRSSVLLIDQNFQVILVNKNFLEKARRLESDTVGKRLTQVFPQILLDEMRLEQRIRMVFQENKATQAQRLSYRAPGVPMRIYYYSIIPISWDARVENVMLLMDDITEQIRLAEEVRRVERHLASIVESASDIVLSTDTQGRILTWNKAAERISGYCFDEVRDRCFHEFCAGDRERVKALFTLGGISQMSSEMVEYELVTKQGSLVQISWVFSPMKDDIDRIVGVVAVGRDLTERRKIEMQLLQSQKLAALGVMAGGIAHEIRNPLAISSSAAQFLMEEDQTPEFRKECADKVNTGIRRASVIIENLLRFAHPTARIETKQVNLITVLTQGLALIANQARIQMVELKSDFPAYPVVITGSASLLEQAFMNIFLNALEAMPGGGTLSVSVEKSDGMILVRIADTGRGISSAEIGNIFDPFYSTSTAKGTGLGLSICYSIVKQHFGSIEVDSIKGRGSTFTVRFHLV